MDLKLSRLNLTGPIDDTTPLDVIEEILDAHSINSSDYPNIEEVIKVANLNQVYIMNHPRNRGDYNHLLVFINHKINWIMEDLDKAYNWYLTFSKNQNFTNINPNFIFGRQTPDCLESLNCCIIYAACKYFQIPLTRDTPGDEMAQNLREFLTNSQLILESIFYKLVELPPRELLNIHSKLFSPVKVKKTPRESKRSNKHKDSSSLLLSEENQVLPNPLENQKQEFKKESLENPTYEELKKSALEILKYYSTEDDIKSHKCANSADAVVIAALCFKIDLSENSNPIETLELIKSGKYRSTSKFKFNPGLPKDLYSSSSLNIFLKQEGYLEEDLETLNAEEKYEQLQLISLSNNFYPGKMSPSKNTETIVDLENIENLNSEECLSYGKDEYFILTYKEIDVSIKATKNVVTPLGKEIVFTDFNIKKLLWFCNKPKKSQESSKIYEIRKSIYATIIGLSEVSDTSNLILQKMQEDKSGTNADIVKKFMTLLIEISMNMRGWNGSDGPNGYPIEKSHNLTLESIENRVSESFKELELYTENFKDLCEPILKLPLVKYVTDKYIASDQYNGLTIGDRLNIVKDNNSVYACIRMSSNWIASSAYKYCIILGITPGFDIKKLRHIS